MTKMTHLSLFSGIGGLDIAAEWAGFETVGQCEWADYPNKVLEKHWPDVPRWRDIHTLTKEDFYGRTGLRTVDVISGGFPCQPFSTAGKRRGKADDRYLWPEMLRVVRELRPDWVVGENVAGIVSLALDQVLSDLESVGYTCQTFIIPACAVDAPHRRDRCAIVAYTNSGRRLHRSVCEQTEKSGQSTQLESCKCSSYVSNTTCKRLEEQTEPKKQHTKCGWWEAEPNVDRVADEVSNRVDRLKCLGNAVVPQQFYPIFDAISKIQGGVCND